MIEDKETGLKVAENSEEAYWEKIRKQGNDHILNMKHEISIHESIVELAEKKLKESKSK